MAEPIDMILWDNDGVLVDTERLYYEASRRVYAELGEALTEDVFREASLGRGVSLIDLLVERGAVTEDELPALRDHRNDVYQALLEQKDVVVDGTLDTLQTLNDRVRMAIVTSSNRIHFDVMHRTTGITEFMEFSQCSEEIGIWKPRPEPYLHAVERAGVDPARCLVVEDSERGLASAVAARLRTWVIPHALSKGGRFEGAERVLRSIREIPALVEAENT